MTSFNQQAISVKQPDLSNVGNQNFPLRYPINSNLNALSHAYIRYIHQVHTIFTPSLLFSLSRTPIFLTSRFQQTTSNLNWIVPDRTNRRESIYSRALKSVLTSILTAPWASSSFRRAFFWMSWTRHFLKYVTCCKGENEKSAGVCSGEGMCVCMWYALLSCFEMPVLPLPDLAGWLLAVFVLLSLGRVDIGF